MKIAAYVFLFILCTTAANVFLKVGVAGKISKVTDYIDVLLSWRIVLGVSLFGLAMILWLLILRQIPLSLAQSFSAIQFVAVIFVSRFILDESIDSRQWVGMAFIALGIVIVGWGQEQ